MKYVVKRGTDFKYETRACALQLVVSLLSA